MEGMDYFVRSKAASNLAERMRSHHALFNLDLLLYIIAVKDIEKKLVPPYIGRGNFSPFLCIKVIKPPSGLAFHFILLPLSSAG